MVFNKVRSAIRIEYNSNPELRRQVDRLAETGAAGSAVGSRLHKEQI